MIEGRVPAADIRKLLAQRPDGIGLRVLGMPYGSPGMGPETEREAYDGFLICNVRSIKVVSLRGRLRGRRRGAHDACRRQRL